MKGFLAALLLVLIAGCIDVGPQAEATQEPPCIPVLEPASGSFAGNWTRPATVGPQEREWQPSPLGWADAEHVARLDSIDLVLEWTNAPQGSADFGIALGRDGQFRYWNGAYQTSLGPQHESLKVGRAELEQYGFTAGDHLDAGPSVSTGAYSAASPVAYTLSWTATFQPPPEGQACPSMAQSTATQGPQA